MPEAISLCAIGFLSLAAASHRFRRDAGIVGARQVRLFRLLAAVAIALACLICGTTLPGERWVALLASASIAAVIVTVALSVAPSVILAPVRRLLGAGRP